eukprot:scaffold303823_cov24-Tisochrysis_lutea.AAC.4
MDDFIADDDDEEGAPRFAMYWTHANRGLTRGPFAPRFQESAEESDEFGGMDDDDDDDEPVKPKKKR